MEELLILIDWTFWVVSGIASEFFGLRVNLVIDVRLVSYCTYVDFFSDR